MTAIGPLERRRLAVLLLGALGLASVGMLLWSRSSDTPAARDASGGEAQPSPSPTDVRGERLEPAGGRATAVRDGERPLSALAGRITGSLERASGQDETWRCPYQVTTASGVVLVSGSALAGRFAVDWPFEPRASIAFRAPGCRTFEAELPAQTTDLGAIRLLPSLLYRGRLQSAAGVPVAGAFVELMGRGGSRAGRGAVTDERGGFALEADLRELPFPSPDGSTYPDVWLLATREDRGGTCVVPARPAGFFDTHVAVVEFERGLVILVRRPDGTPVAGASVQLDPDTEEGGSSSAALSAFGATTEADGRCSVGWPPKLRQVRVRALVPGEPEAVGFLREADARGKDPVVLTLPVDGNRIVLSLRRDRAGSPGDRDVLSLRAGWTTPGGGPGDAGFDSIGLEAPVPPDGEPWSVRLLDSPSLRFEQLLTSARWRARYLGGKGQPAFSDGTVELLREHANLEGGLLLPSESSSAEPEDVLWLRIREDDLAGGAVESLSLATSRNGRVGPSWHGRVAWSTSSPIGAGDRLVAIEGIPPPRQPNADATTPDTVSIVLRTSGGGQRISRSSLAQWAGAYDAETPLLLDLAPTGSLVRVLSRSSEGTILPNVQLLAMCVGAPIGSEPWTQEEHVTDASGGADVLSARADADLLVLAKTVDGRMGRVLVKAGVSRAEVVLRAGEVFVTTIRLFDGRTPARAYADLVTRPFSRWTVPCVWDAAAARFTTANPVLLDLFEVQMDAEAIEQTGASALERKEHRYRLAVPAQDAQGRTVELPRLHPRAFEVR